MAGSTLDRLFRELGLVTKDDVEELELRIAQLEHRLRLLEDPPEEVPGPQVQRRPMARAPPRSLGRISEIAQVAVRHGFGYFFRRNKLTDLIGDDGELLSEAPSERGRHLREMLDELNPTFVKFGQLLSMRPDVLPPDIIAELRGLQDDVTPFSYEEAAQVIEESLGQPVERLFLEFDPVPMAAASIGQVHRAVLPNGRTVAVKVQRPGAPRQIEADLNLMYQAARLAKERVRALDFIDSARARRRVCARSGWSSITAARRATRRPSRKNFAGHPHVKVPRVYWTYTRPRVLTLEYVEGRSSPTSTPSSTAWRIGVGSPKFSRIPG